MTLTRDAIIGKLPLAPTLVVVAALSSTHAGADERRSALGASGVARETIEQQIEGEVKGRYCSAEFIPGKTNNVLCGSTHPKFGLVVCDGKKCTVGEISGVVTTRPRAPRLVVPGTSEGVRP